MEGTITIPEEYVLTCPFTTSLDIVDLYPKYRYLVLTRDDVNDDNVYDYFYTNIYFREKELDKYKDRMSFTIYSIVLEENKNCKDSRMMRKKRITDLYKFL